MATKEQHFVPRVYLKAWETRVTTSKEPDKSFDGVYYYKDDAIIGEGSTREAILWKPHLYTISFKQHYMTPKCPKVHDYFVTEVWNSMKNNQPNPVYAKCGSSIIKTKRSVSKHILDIDSWEFYYYDGTMARKKALLNRFNDMKCYLIEDSFSVFFETKWDDTLKTFVKEVQDSIPVSIDGERQIKISTAMDMMEFFFMMLCRSPQFDAMGIYSLMSSILKESYSDVEEVDDMMEAVWFTELYRVFYKERGGFYHTTLSKAVENCQIILFEAYSDAGTFITSDNPAFQHISYVEAENMNAYYFPISPYHFLMIVKGHGPINMIDYRMANSELVKTFNRIVASHSSGIIVSNEKCRDKIL